MATITPTLLIPEYLQPGLASGLLWRDGGVIRDNAGRLVKMLDEVKTFRPPRGKGKIVVITVVVVAAATSAIYVYTQFNRKARLARKLAKVDKTIQTSVAEHHSELTRADVQSIRDSIDEFLRASEQRPYQNVTLILPDDASRMLIGFAEALHSFSAKLNELPGSVESVPALEFSPGTPQLLPLLETIRAQLAYQERNWPTPPPTPPPLQLDPQSEG